MPTSPIPLATSPLHDETAPMPRVPVTRTSACLVPDATRVITKPFAAGGELSVAGRARLAHILSRIVSLSQAEVTATLNKTEDRFAARHVDLRSVFEANFAAVSKLAPQPGGLSAERRLLIGAYFTHEYSIEK